MKVDANGVATMLVSTTVRESGHTVRRRFDLPPNPVFSWTNGPYAPCQFVLPVRIRPNRRRCQMMTQPKKSRWFRRASVAGTTAAAIAMGATTAAVITSSGTSDASSEQTVSERPSPITLVDDRAQTMARVDASNRWVAGQERKRKLAKLAKIRQQRAERAARDEQRRALLSADPRTVARAMLSRFGWGASQFGCLDSLWRKESGWNLHAENPSSGAYGIPQALPGSKMSSAGGDWHDNPVTQIAWGLGYIRSSYGSPCGAWAHSEGSGWY